VNGRAAKLVVDTGSRRTILSSELLQVRALATARAGAPAYRSGYAGSAVRALRATRVKLSRADPIGLQSWWLQQGLHNDTILFGFFLQAAQLLRCCLRRINVECEPDALEANGHILCYTEGASEIQISFDGDLDAVRRYTHGCGHHLASKLCAGRQSAEQHIAGTSRSTRASYPGVRFGTVHGATDGNRAGNGCLGLSAFSLKSDSRGGGVLAVLFFQGFLNRLKIHDDLRCRAQYGIVASLGAC